MRIAALDKRQWEEGIAQDQDDGLDQASRQELTDIVVDVIMQMRLNYRNVLVLRCFEQMSYAQIGEMMGCKELRARVLFFRALRALKIQLARKGIARTTLGVGLGLFGLLTSHSKFVTSHVVASTLDVGFMGTVVGMLATKGGIAVTSLVGTILLGLTLQKLALTLGVAVLLLVCLAAANLFADA